MFKYPSIMYVDSFESVFKAVERGLCRYGILPLENSTAGSVTAVYELMQKYKFYIVGSTRLCIGHSLLSNEGASLMTVKEIFSHEQALNQCSEFLSKLEGVKITVCENTASAAKAVADSDGPTPPRSARQTAPSCTISPRSALASPTPRTTTRALSASPRISKFIRAQTAPALWRAFPTSPAPFTT